MRQTVLKLLGTVVLCLALSSCYIPDKFKAELRLSRFGDYVLTFDGDVIHAPTIHDYAQGKITKQDEPQRMENIRADLIRDQAVKLLEPRGQGRFHMRYERSGRVGKTQLTSLLRRDARIISFKGYENNSIVIYGASVKPAESQRMAQLGLTMQGEFRIVTDANVVNHNASEVRDWGQYRVYIWRMENALSPSPRLVMIRDIDPSRPLN